LQPETYTIEDELLYVAEHLNQEDKPLFQLSEVQERPLLNNEIHTLLKNVESKRSLQEKII
jgi:hypothetical protein